MKTFEILETGARYFPDNRAIVHGDREISYRQLLLSSIQVARYLENFGLAEGSRVAILYENSVEYVTFFFAVFKAGFVAVPLDTSLKPDKLRFIISDCNAEVLLVHSKYKRFLDKIADQGSSLRLIISDKELNLAESNIATEILSNILSQPLERQDYNLPSADVTDREFGSSDFFGKIPDSPHELAAIFYTSGSTGTSKGVMLSHRNLVSNTIATVEYLKLRDNDSVLVVLPFYYIYGNSLLLTHAFVGGTLIVENRNIYPEVVLDTMEKEKATGFSGVPSNFIIMLNNSTMPSRKLEHLRYFTQAGGSMAPEIIRKLMNVFPKKEIYIMYGQTEASPRVSYLPPERLKDKIGSIGIPVPGVNIKVMNDKGSEMPVGESGELAVSGGNVMLGYWNQSEETKETVRDGWLYTGDMAKRDEEGYFYITGRKKEIIKSGGNRVSAKEIEECILENEKVLEVAIFGVEDDLLGEAIKAVISLKKDQYSDKKEIQIFCRERLGEHKVPKYVEFSRSLPKHQSGKVDKVLLKSMT